MIQSVILDTGPLVAFMHSSDHHHAWSRDILKQIEAPLITCEAVLSEAAFLLARWPQAVHKLGSFIQNGIIETPFSLKGCSNDVFALMKRYASLPMPFADACLVSMSEQTEGARVLTLDSDFEIYRRHRRKKIPLLAPWLED